MKTRKINEIEMHPRNASLKDADYSIEEEADIYDKQLQHIYDNPGLYLDAIEGNFLRTYKVRWKNYRSKTPTIPYKYTKKGGNANTFIKETPPI